METVGRDLAEMHRVPLAPEHVAALRAAGTTVRFAAGEMVTEAGRPADRLGGVDKLAAPDAPMLLEH